jgi:ATP-dependent DNA helicase RecQ
VQSTFNRDGAPSQELRDAAVAALSHWRASWPARPEVVIALSVAGYPVMTGGLADHVAQVGGLGRADFIVAVDTGGVREPVVGAGGGAVGDAISVNDQLCLSSVTKCCCSWLDASSTQWPITVAAAHLRQAQASLVLAAVGSPSSLRCRQPHEARHHQ